MTKNKTAKSTKIEWTDQPLSGDPYEAALAAFIALNPEATGQQWEDWTQDNYFNPSGQFDNFGAFVSL